jgi:hypothetical protein
VNPDPVSRLQARPPPPKRPPRRRTQTSSLRGPGPDVPGGEAGDGMADLAPLPSRSRTTDRSVLIDETRRADGRDANHVRHLDTDERCRPRGDQTAAADAAAAAWNERTSSRSKHLNDLRTDAARQGAAWQQLLALQADVHLFEDNELMHRADQSRHRRTEWLANAATVIGVLMMWLGFLSFVAAETSAAAWCLTHMSSWSVGSRIMCGSGVMVLGTLTTVGGAAATSRTVRRSRRRGK